MRCPRKRQPGTRAPPRKVRAGAVALPRKVRAGPVDWQPVAITNATCPDGFGSPQTFHTSATGAAFTCSCGCSGTQHCAGSVTLNQFGGDAGVSCGGTPTTRTFGVTANCQSGNYG